MPMILQTKLYPPPRQAAFVARNHLQHVFQTGLRRKLTLLSAPAGFGKTTLVSNWLHDRDVPFAWLSLSDDDNDPTRFWTYVVAALQTVTPELGVGVHELLEAPQVPPLETVVGMLINAVVDPDRASPPADTPLVLVLDDYHEIRDVAIHRSVNYLLDHQPPTLHLMVLTRSDPPLKLARRLGRREMVEVRAADLRLSLPEATAFLNDVMALDLSEADVEALATRTEGWIASLQLAAISLRTHPDPPAFIATFAGDDRYVVDYLLDEVFIQQAEAVQTFLLKTSILDRLSGPLCDAVVHGDGADRERQQAGQAMLTDLERSNLFLVPLDNRRQWYRYHQLFADMLQQRLRRTLPDEVAALHQRASRWFEQAGDVENAIRYAVKGADWDHAAWLLGAFVKTMWGRSQQGTICRFLDAFPPAVLREAPDLCFWYAWALLLTGRMDEYERPLVWAEQAWHAQDNQAMLGRVAIVRAVEARTRGDYQAMSNHARTALALLPDDMTFARGHSTLLLALGLVYTGKADEAWPIILKARAILQSAGNTFMTSLADSITARIYLHRGKVREALQPFYSLEDEAAWTHQLSTSYFVARGMVHYELNELDEAERYLKQARDSMRHTHREIFWSRCYVMLARAARARGDAPRVFEHIDRALTVARKSGDLVHIHQAEALQVHLWLAQGDQAKAARLLDGRTFSEEDPIPFERAVEYEALARIRLAEGAHEEALRLLDRLLEAAEADGRVYHAVRLLVMKALAERASGKQKKAFETLQQALARGDGYIRSFLDEGPPLFHLLREAALHDVASDRIPDLLEAFEQEPTIQRLEEKPGAVSPGPAEILVEMLSDRELDVLRLIAEGLSNPEIAERLFVSLNTVKTHAKNINAKLNVHNRREAVARARLLNLL